MNNSKIVLQDPPIVAFSVQGLSDALKISQDLYLSRESNLNSLRKSIYPHEHPSLEKILNPLKADLNKLLIQLLDIDSTHQFRRYRAEPSRILDRLNLALLPTLDQVGFSQGTHIDNRLVVAAGSINLKDNSCATEFYSERNGTKLYEGVKQKDHGTIWLNTEVTWHAVPEVKQDRNTLLVQWMWV